MRIFAPFILAILLFACKKSNVNNISSQRNTNVFGHPLASVSLKAKDIYVNNEDTGYHFIYENDLLVKIIKGENNDTTKTYSFLYDSEQHLTNVSIKYNGFHCDMAMEYDSVGRVNKMRETSFYHEEYAISYPETNVVAIAGRLWGDLIKDTLFFDNDYRVIANRHYRINTTYHDTIITFENYTYSTLNHFLANSPAQDVMMLLKPVEHNYSPFEWPFVGGKNLITSCNFGYVNFGNGTSTLSSFNVTNNFPTFTDYSRDNSPMAPWATSIKITYY